MMQTPRSHAAQAAAIPAALLLCPADAVLAQTSGQSRERPPDIDVVVMSDAQVLDEAAKDRGLDAQTVTGALKFILSLDPDLRVVSAGANLPDTRTSAGEA